MKFNVYSLEATVSLNFTFPQTHLLLSSGFAFSDTCSNHSPVKIAEPRVLK